VKKIFLILFVFELVFAMIPITRVSALANSNERVVILFKDNIDKDAVLEVKGKINREFNHVPALAVTIPANAIRGLQNNPNILLIENDEVVTVKQIQDWGISRIEAPKAWECGLTGKGVRIAVVDTGIAIHEDLNIADGASFTSYTSSFYDDNGHGTHVAGIIGSTNNNFGTVGIAHQSSIFAVKVLDSKGNGYLSDIIAGIDWSITNKMDIINLSLGSTNHSSTLKKVVDKAYNQGILVVAAAGNNGTPDGLGDTVNYPARYDSVIAVSATDVNDKRALFSATGSTVEVSAPGVSILSTYLGNKYTQMNGTSMAAPYVAGNLALLKQAYPNLKNTELRVLLQGNIVDLGVEGKDSWFGYGLISTPKYLQEEPKTNEPIEEEENILETNTNLAIDKEYYTAGENVTISVIVSDEHGNVLVGAEVKVSITTPKGELIIFKGTTDPNGFFSFVMGTKKNFVKGLYEVIADTTKNFYGNSSSKVSFEIR
jgi:minor extracellular protease Epr